MKLEQHLCTNKVGKETANGERGEGEGGIGEG